MRADKIGEILIENTYVPKSVTEAHQTLNQNLNQNSTAQQEMFIQSTGGAQTTDGARTGS